MTRGLAAERAAPLDCGNEIAPPGKLVDLSKFVQRSGLAAIHAPAISLAAIFKMLTARQPARPA